MAARQCFRQRHPQALRVASHFSPGDRLAVGVVALVRVAVEHAQREGVGPAGRGLGGRCGRRLQPRAHQPLVAQRMGRGEQRLAQRHRQRLEAQLEFALQQRPEHRRPGVRVQAATGQQGGQGIAGEEAQVAAVEQALVAVLEAALEQCGDQPGIGHVGHRDQQHPARRQQCLQLLQHRLGVHHVLDHVGRHDHLVARAAERVRPGRVARGRRAPAGGSTAGPAPPSRDPVPPRPRCSRAPRAARA